VILQKLSKGIEIFKILTLNFVETNLTECLLSNGKNHKRELEKEFTSHLNRNFNAGSINCRQALNESHLTPTRVGRRPHRRIRI